MPALIVWNNSETYDNDTWCIAVEPELLSAALKLIGEIDGGSILAVADEARFTCEPHTLDDWIRRQAFHLCITNPSMYDEDKMPALMTLPLELRKKIADALLVELSYGGCHESWKPVAEKIAAELRGEASR